MAEISQKQTIVIYLVSSDVDCFNFTPDHTAKLRQALPESEIVICQSEIQFVAALTQADISFSWYFNPQWLALAPKLKRIVTPMAGRETFNFAVPDRITIEHGAFHKKIIAPTVLSFVLCHCRQLLSCLDLQERENNWPRYELSLTARSLYKTQVTILGFGHIGVEIGRILQDFGAIISGVSQTPKPRPDWMNSQGQVLTLSSLDSVLPHSDYLILALPKTSATDHIVNARILSLLPKTAAIINVGRGNAIDETALAQALNDEVISAAYLDVVSVEPIVSDNPLLKAKNCFIYPHASAFSPEYLDLFIDEFLQRKTVNN